MVGAQVHPLTKQQEPIVLSYWPAVFKGNYCFEHPLASGPVFGASLRVLGEATPIRGNGEDPVAIDPEDGIKAN
jgi:hypothetical protein